MNAREIMQRLKAPFPAERLGWKPGKLTADGKRCLAMAYIDARDVQGRLDDVMGIENWQDHYELSSGVVVCTLSLRIAGEWIPRMDVGALSDQPGAGDQIKAAVSDALKRAAVKFGVGRYLYYLDSAWADYDPQKKKIVKAPALPAWALPEPAAPPVDEDLRVKTLAILEPAALKGLATYQLAWGTLSMDMRRSVVKSDHPRLKEQAAKVKAPAPAPAPVERREVEHAAAG
jgi:hypothetical protein